MFGPASARETTRALLALVCAILLKPRLMLTSSEITNVNARIIVVDTADADVHGAARARGSSARRCTAAVTDHSAKTF